MRIEKSDRSNAISLKQRRKSLHTEEFNQNNFSQHKAKSLSTENILHLQRTIGNQAVIQLLKKDKSIQRESWDGAPDNPGVTWHGTWEVPNGKAQEDPMNCWSTAIGEVLKINQITIKTLMGISKYKTDGLTAEDEVKFLKKVKRTLKRDLTKKSWADIQADAANNPSPIALAVTGHYIVLMAMGVNADGSIYGVQYWDPADAGYHVNTLVDFEANWAPAYGYHKS
jgi:hypothetical protein